MKKFALITGAASGIGLATSQELLKNGWNIIAVGRSQQKLSALKKISPDQILTFACDISNAQEVEKLLSNLKEQNLFSQIKALINNAGIWKRVSFFESSDEFWQEQFNTNVLGSVRLTRELLKLMIEAQQTLSIVNVASTLAHRPVPHTSAYSASKAAMVSWTQVLALEVAQFKIRVNCVCPGLVDTPIHAQGALSGLENAQPLGRLGLPQDIANGIKYLVSEDSNWVTGTVLNIDGGISLL